jgi:hypothetical protein
MRNIFYLLFLIAIAFSILLIAQPDTVNVPDGNHLTIVTPEPGQTQHAAPPQIVWPDSYLNIIQFSNKAIS